MAPKRVWVYGFGVCVPSPANNIPRPNLGTVKRFPKHIPTSLDKIDSLTLTNSRLSIIYDLSSVCATMPTCLQTRNHTTPPPQTKNGLSALYVKTTNTLPPPQTASAVLRNIIHSGAVGRDSNNSCTRVTWLVGTVPIWGAYPDPRQVETDPVSSGGSSIRPAQIDCSPTPQPRFWCQESIQCLRFCLGKPLIWHWL